MIIDDPKQLSTTCETLSYLHWIRQMAPTEAEKTTRMRAKANKDPRRSWIWLMSENEADQTQQVWSQVVKFTKFIQCYSEHFWENLHRERHNIHTTLFRTFIIIILSFTTRLQTLNNIHPMLFRRFLGEPSLWVAIQLCGMAPPPLQVFLESPQGLEIR